jgi:arylsulfatase A-like enzyme
MAKLEELKLADNTVVIFASDNGGVGGYAREGLQSAIASRQMNVAARGLGWRQGRRGSAVTGSHWRR